MDIRGAVPTSLAQRGTRRFLALATLVIASVLGVAEPALATPSTVASSSPASTATKTSTASASTTSATATPATATSTGAAAATTNAATTTATAPQANQPTTAATSRILDVPLYMQTLALSCEEAALRMALASEGIYTTDSQVLAIIGTDTRAAYVDGSGLHWGNPYTSFVGNPSGSQVNLSGYGTYYPTIARAATSLGGQVIASGEGISPSSVYAAILAGHPVMAWVTYQWVSAERSDYTAFDGTVIPYAGPVEHAVTVVGVTPTEVYINNPDTGVEVISKSLFEASYATYNNMAVILK